MTKINSESIAKDRYEFKPFYGSSHFWALNELQKLVNSKKNLQILDVGPGIGYVANFFNTHSKTNNLDYTLHAIEPDIESAKTLTDKYTKIFSSDFELLDNTNTDITNYDLIILMDVLEHMAKPEVFLKNIANKLNPGGMILISVPNVAHWSIRIPLLFGFFEYQERGPMDKTHLQFFSIRRFQNLQKLLNNTVISNTSYSIEPLEYFLPTTLHHNFFFLTISKFREKIAKIFPGLFAYQFLTKITKND